MRKPADCLLLLGAAILLAATDASAAWVVNGISIASETYGQRLPRAVSDGAGGAVQVWQDGRNVPPYGGIYAQKIDGYGNARWTSNGTPVYANGFLSYLAPEIASDGTGGAIVVWGDNRSGGFDLFAQRIDATGALRWGESGVAICSAATVQRNYAIIADGEGGATIAWQDSSSGSADIFAQRVDAGGAAQWTPGGVAICTNTFEQHEPCLVADGLGGAIIAWDDHRSGPTNIYAQRVVAGGGVAWTANGTVICNAVNAQQEQCIVSDDAGGAVIAWRDYRNSADWLVYAQRISGSGLAVWAANGVAASTTVTDAYQLAMASDGRNGAILVWAQTVSGEQNLYAQRMSYLGYREWSAGGNVVCNATGAQADPAIVPDGNRGAVIAWHDYRSGTVNKDIYAQKISAEGLQEWGPGGAAACAEASDQDWPCIVSDGVGGALVGWEDYRNDAGMADIYAQRIERNGFWGYPSPVITSVLDVPMDQGGLVTVVWQKSRLESVMASTIDRYSVWRRLPAARLAGIEESGAKGIAPTELRAAPVGTTYVSSANGAATGWELLRYVDATVSATYSAEAPTLADATVADPGLHHFMVMAHAADHFTFWESEPDSGFSLDNLAPAQPADFSAQLSFAPFGLLLAWSVVSGGAKAEADFSHFELHRGTSPEFTPAPDNRIYSGPGTAYLDDEWRLDSNVCYKLSAVDVHGNASTYGFLDPDDLTDVDTPNVPVVTFLAQSAPNPFNPSTAIGYGLAARGNVTLAIYDVMGRLVRTLVDEPRIAGRYTEVWDGRDAGGCAVASGVYFYRLRLGSFNESKKMVLAR